MPVTHENCDQTIDVIAKLYCEHIYLNVLKIGNLYQRTDPVVPWFLNITGYQRQIILAFDNRIDCENCCDNYIYNYREVEQIPVFEAYNMTAKLDMMYKGVTEYSNLLL